MNITDEKVTAYIEGLYQPSSTLLHELRVQAEKDHIPIVLRDTETLLQTLLAIKRPKRILEIGTAVGYSALCFAFACPEASITTIELQERMVKEAKKNIERANCADRIFMLQGDAVQVLERMIKEANTEPFDFVFIDGAKGHYLEVFPLCETLCTKEAILVSDNILFRAMTAADEYLDIRRNKTIVNRMRAFLTYITTRADLTTTVLPVGDGVAISVRKGDLDG